MENKKGVKHFIFSLLLEKTPVFKLGTLAWARVGGHPYWPCLVTKEPESNIFKKESKNFIVIKLLTNYYVWKGVILITFSFSVIKIGLPKTVYHVRFFGDKGKRAWIMEPKMMQYNNKDDVELLLQKAKKQVKYQNGFCEIKARLGIHILHYKCSSKFLFIGSSGSTWQSH